MWRSDRGVVGGAAILLVVALRHTVLALAGVGAFVLGRTGTGALALDLVVSFVALVALGVGVRLARRARPGHVALAVGAVVLVYVGGGYALSVVQRRAGSFAGLATYAPHERFHDGTPGRPPLWYRTNALGFREPEIARTKTATRVALIGDSYVFGMGVPLAGTLSAQLGAELSRRGQRVEVLNLGFPGHNLASHVTLYAAAGRELHADVAVVCLTLPNNLSRWDSEDERHDASRASLYSLAAYGLGTNLTGALWGRRLLAEGTTADGLANLDAQAARLSVLTRAHTAPALYLFTFQPNDRDVDARLRRIRGAQPIAPPSPRDDDFIRGDGHPTAAGNRRFAVAIADAITPALAAPP